VRPPALLILGEVAALATSLAWFGQPPLGAAVRDIRGAMQLKPSRDQPLHDPGRQAKPRPRDDLLVAIHRA
jgi:uroporphyrin-III C-methyltransferase/precorrin-2 dehydrogenase/sirohydrochlorin ferrochelatase